MNNNLHELYESFVEFENTLSISDDLVYIWEGLRFKIFELLQHKLLNSHTAHDSIIISKLSRNKRYRLLMEVTVAILKSFTQLTFRMRNYTNISILIFGGGRKKKEEDGLFWDINVDPITQYMNSKDYVVIESPYQFQHSLPSKEKDLIYFDYFRVKFKLNSIKNKFLNFLPKSNKKYCDFFVIEEKLNALFETNIPVAQYAQEYGNSWNYYLKSYKRLLQRLNPQVVLIVCGYGKEALIHASKSMGIPIIELQHGTISKYHLGYDVGKGKKDDFADCFFTFGPAWASLANYPIPQERIIPIGYPYLSQAADKLKDTPKKNQILFISQGTIGDRLSKFAVDLLGGKPKDVHVVYKLHPGEYLRWKTEYVELFDEHNKGNITVIAGDAPSLYQLMAESKWQIGSNSTALYEGMMFKCKTFIVDLPGKEHMQELLDSGNFLLVKSPNELDFSYDQKSLSYATEEYFSSNTKDRFLSAMEFVLNNLKAQENLNINISE